MVSWNDAAEEVRAHLDAIYTRHKKAVIADGDLNFFHRLDTMGKQGNKYAASLAEHMLTHNVGPSSSPSLKELEDFLMRASDMVADRLFVERRMSSLHPDASPRVAVTILTEELEADRRAVFHRDALKYATNAEREEVIKGPDIGRDTGADGCSKYAKLIAELQARYLKLEERRLRREETEVERKAAAERKERYDNISIRDALAGQTLAALIAHDGLSRPPEQCAALVYKYVDALLLKGLEKTDVDRTD